MVPIEVSHTTVYNIPFGSSSQQISPFCFENLLCRTQSLRIAERVGGSAWGGDETVRKHRSSLFFIPGWFLWFSSFIFHRSSFIIFRAFIMKSRGLTVIGIVTEIFLLSCFLMSICWLSFLKFWFTWGWTQICGWNTCVVRFYD